MPSMIGLIMLMGIVTKHSILLVDYAILARQAGMNRFDALVGAAAPPPGSAEELRAAAAELAAARRAER